MKIRKLLAVLMTLAMTLSCLGITAWAETTEALELVEGENDILAPADGTEVSFIPERDGYYTIEVLDGSAACYLDAETVGDDVSEYYLLEAGVTYFGGAYSWTDEDVEATVLVQYVENVSIKAPVDLEMVSLPDNTTYLSSVVNTNPEDAFDNTGMVVNILWDDGTVTPWNLAEDGNWVGGEVIIVQEMLWDEEDVWVEVYLSDVEMEPVIVELTVLDITAESIALVDETPLKVVENSCGMDLGMLDESLEGWYYLPMQAYTREVVITFSDGSTVNAMPGESVYGLPIEVADNQLGGLMSEDALFGGFWTKDGENYVTFCYEEVYADLAVEIVDSPVAAIELVTPPKNNVIMLNDAFEMVNADGELIASTRDFFEGLSLKVTLLDGSSRTFGGDEIQWINIGGEDIPFVDGYPLGVIGGLLGLLWQEVEVPCELEIVIEYMGAEDSYILSIVEEFEEDEDPENPENPENPEDPEDPEDQKPEVEPNPETGDVSLLVPVILVLTAMLTVVLVFKKKEF